LLILHSIQCLYRGHPHVCGEESLPITNPVSYLGTPPRVWGRAQVADGIATLEGDTPTCVGKSKGIRFILNAPKGHPHVCGEECKVAKGNSAR